MNEGIKKSILEGDDRAVRGALHHEWNVEELAELYAQAKASGDDQRANLIASRMSYVRSR